MNEKTKKKLDIVLLILFPVLATCISIFLKTNLLISTLLFFGLPALYLSLRTKKAILRAILFTLITVPTFGLLIDYIGFLNNAWYTIDTIFPFRLFGGIPLENPLWAILYAYSIVIFYEHFLEKGKHKLINNHMIYLVMLLISLFLIYFILFILKQDLLSNIPYFYFITGTVFFLVPVIAFLFSFPGLIRKFLITASYFFILSLLNELVALQLHHWTFPGRQFIGWIEIFHLRFPLGEFIFFIFIGSIGTLTYYEFFDEDRKKLI